MPANPQLAEQAAADVAALAARLEASSLSTLPLDRSFESLDRIEDFVRAHPEDAAKVASYIGETLIAHAGGRWEPPKVGTDDGDAPLVTKLGIVPKARFYPFEVADDAIRLSRPVIRDAVEHHDIRHRREVLARELARLPEELDALRDDVGRIIGRAPVVLDDSPDVLRAVEKVLVAAKGAGRDATRRAQARAVLFLGDLVQRKIDGGWTVCEDWRGDSLGEFESHGWAPARVVANVAPNNRNIFERTLPLVYKRGAK